MAHNNSYPSPSAAQVSEGAGPFYASQQTQRLPEEDIELTAQLSRELGPPVGYAPNHMGYQPMSGAPTAPVSRPFDASNAEEASARKKSKVSRACDECRRKKIRCDAESDAPGHAKCSNCSRTQQACQFSRQPMKRGPSKGYIKELADRIDQMEKKVTGGVPAPYTSLSPVQPSAQFPNEQGQGQDTNTNRKRTHSMSEHGVNGEWQARDVASFPNGYGESGPTAPFAHMTYNTVPSTSPNVRLHTLLVPQKIADNQRETPGDMQDFSPANEQLLAEYYRVLHPTVPLLPISSLTLRFLLASCLTHSNIVFQTFFVVLHLVLSRLSFNLDAFNDNDPRFKELLRQFLILELDDIPTCVNVVIVQICAMILLAFDISGPRGPSCSHISQKPIWFAIAARASAQLKLFARGFDLGPNPDTDSEIMAARRALWACIVVDRFHSMGTSERQCFPENNIDLTKQDRVMLGNSFYRLVNFSDALSSIVQMFSFPVSSEPENAPFMHRQMRAWTRLLEDEDLSTSPFHEAVVNHCKILVGRVAMSGPAKYPVDIFGPALNIVAALSKPEYPVNPFTYHFVALAAKTLADVATYEDLKVIAFQGLNELQQVVEQKRLLGNVSGPGSWDQLLTKFMHAKLRVEPGNAASLQRLADTAVGGGQEEPVDDWSFLVKVGYLRIFE